VQVESPQGQVSTVRRCRPSTQPGRTTGCQLTSAVPVPILRATSLKFEITTIYEPAEGGIKVILIGEGEPDGLFNLPEGAVNELSAGQLQGD